MNVPILDLQRQYARIKNEVEPLLLEVMRSGQYIMGPQVAAFEKEISEYLNVKHVISVANGTDALAIALVALGIGEGDEVITTPFSFFATAEAISCIGATPVFADIDEETLNLDPSKIEEKITERTKAILPVHIFGQAADMDQINQLAQKYGIAVIEDACQAIGTKYHEKHAGTLGKIACFSFFPTKNLGAFGDAGMITTNDDNLSIVCRALREHAGGKNGAEAKKIMEGGDGTHDTEEINALYNPYKYYNYLIGYNSRMDAMQAVVLRVKLKYLNDFNNARAENARYYSEHLKDLPIILPKESPNTTHCWHQFVIRSEKKDELATHLSKQGITTGAFYPVPLHKQKAYQNSASARTTLPISEKVSAQTLCLPIFPELTKEEMDYVIDKIKEFYKQ